MTSANTNDKQYARLNQLFNSETATILGKTYWLDFWRKTE
ncbi:Uncharacterised protein [Chryseobacterium nakagawai]|nr:Uncharacterised protein [Chryseobacterium nakagawai]